MTRRFAGVGEADLGEHVVDARARQAGGGGEHAQVVARAPAGMEAGRLEHRADVAGRLGELGVGRPSIVALPLVGLTRPSSIRRVVVLPAPFGPRKPVTAPCAGGEAQVVDRGDVAEALGQSVESRLLP